MTVTSEQLSAYADGELGEIEARRVARAIESDPALAAQLERERALRATLAARFAGVAEVPVPDRFLRLIAEDARVVSLAEARDSRTQRRWVPDVRWGGAIAAALVAGVALGQFVPSSAPIESEGGVLFAAADLNAALDRQLAGADGKTRMIVTFKDGAGRWCRGFETSAQAGIACREAKRWRIERIRAFINGGKLPQYRQAGSGTVMAEAQEMAVAAPLDAAQERAAIEAGWR